MGVVGLDIADYKSLYGFTRLINTEIANIKIAKYSPPPLFICNAQSACGLIIVPGTRALNPLQKKIAPP